MKVHSISVIIALSVLLGACHLTAGDKLTQDQIKKLLNDLESASVTKRLKAAELLGEAKLHADEVIPQMKKIMLAEGEDQWAPEPETSIALFGKRGETELLELAGHNDPRIRSRAITALEFTGVSNDNTVKKV